MTGTSTLLHASCLERSSQPGITTRHSGTTAASLNKQSKQIYGTSDQNTFQRKDFFFCSCWLPAGTKPLQVPGKVLHAESSPQSNSLMLPATAGYIGVYYFYLCNTTCTKTKTGFQKCGFSNMVKDSFSQLLGTSLAGCNLSKISE